MVSVLYAILQAHCNDIIFNVNFLYIVLDEDCNHFVQPMFRRTYQAQAKAKRDRQIDKQWTK